ncbi:MAG TPA: hypothetical protein VMT88_09860 [Actinomycetes bacterium]|nr:hypothetical protein [Actinomycetes bacterium]
MKRSRVLVLIMAAIASGSALPALMTTARAAGPSLAIVSLNSAEEQANNQVREASATPDGRYVVFSTLADNVVANDTNEFVDIFVRDTVNGTTSLVSANQVGLPANAISRSPVISDDGRYIVFSSGATDLVDAQTHGTNIYLSDQTTGDLTLVSVNNNSVPQNGGSGFAAVDMTPDGRFVAFTSTATNLSARDSNDTVDVYVRDLQQGKTTLVSVARSGKVAAGRSRDPSISSDGNVVAFLSASSRLVNGDTNGLEDDFARDRAAKSTEIVSVSGDGEAANGKAWFPPSISGGGRFVAFTSVATNLGSTPTEPHRGNVFLHDRETGATKVISKAADGTTCHDCTTPIFSEDGRSILFTSSSPLTSDDQNIAYDAYLWDRPNQQMILISKPLDGPNTALAPAYAVAISGDGRFVYFSSDDDQLVPNDTQPYADLFVLDRTG